MIRHIVLFKFKAEVPEVDRAAFLAMLRGLPEKIAEVQALEAGADVLHSPRSFDVGLVSSFADLDALACYAKHEHHLPVVERSKAICEQVVAVDYEQ